MLFRSNQLKSLDLTAHPATADFVLHLRPYSLIPLVSAYVGGSQLDNYDEAFAWYLQHDGRFMAVETSLENELVTLFKEVTFEPR